jgi:tetratricopeptide (TPR) repeat protein
MNRCSVYVFLGLCLACGLLCGPVGGSQTLPSDAERDYYAGRYNHAVDELTAAIVRSPNDGSLYFLLGQSYFQLREFPRAITSLERAVELAPKQSDYHDWLPENAPGI